MARLDGFCLDLESLRQAVASVCQQRGVATLAVLGQIRGAGASTVTWQLARSLARADQAVTVVDANFARPALTGFAGLPPGPGLREALADPTGLPAAPRAIVGLPGLGVVGAGTRTTPTAPLAIGRWRSLLAAIPKCAPLTLVDAGDGHDPQAMAAAAAAGAVVVVVPAARVRWQAVASTVARLRAHDATVLGVVVNRRRFDLPGFLYRSL